MSDTPCSGLGIYVLDRSVKARRIREKKKLTGPLIIYVIEVQPTTRGKSHLDEVRSIYQQPLLHHKEAAVLGTLQNQQLQVLG